MMAETILQSNPGRIAAKLVLCSAMFGLAACGQPSGKSADQPGDANATPVGAAASAPATPAATASATLPPEALAAWERFARGECRTLGARFQPVRFVPARSVDPEREQAATQGAFFAAELNGDGRPDYVVTTENWGCAGEADHGKMGPPHDFILSSAGGYQAAYGFNGGVGPDDVKRRGKSDVIEYRRGWNGSCGYIETAVWGWNGKAMDVIERRNDKGQIVDKEGCPVSASSRASAAATGFPPIPKGYYAVGVSCAQAANAEAAADGPSSLVWFDQEGLTWFDGGPQIKGFEALGSNRYRVRARSYGNGDDPTGHAADFVIRLTGPTSFVSERGGFFDRQESYTHCPTDSMPKDVRSWFEG